MVLATVALNARYQLKFTQPFVVSKQPWEQAANVACDDARMDTAANAAIPTPASNSLLALLFMIGPPRKLKTHYTRFSYIRRLLQVRHPTTTAAATSRHPAIAAAIRRAADAPSWALVGMGVRRP